MACATLRTGGRSNSFGYTAPQLREQQWDRRDARSTTCRPCVKRYRPTGRAGSVNPNDGCWAKCEYSPVRKQTVKVTPSARPSRAATRSSCTRAGERGHPAASTGSVTVVDRRCEPGRRDVVPRRRSRPRMCRRHAARRAARGAQPEARRGGRVGRRRCASVLIGTPTKTRGSALTESDGPPAAVAGGSEHGVDAGRVQLVYRRCEQYRGNLRRVHADQRCRSGDGREGVREPFVEAATELRDDDEAGRDPGAGRAVEREDVRGCRRLRDCGKGVGERGRCERSCLMRVCTAGRGVSSRGRAPATSRSR